MGQLFVYPNTVESQLGVDHILQWLASQAISREAKEQILSLQASTDVSVIRCWLKEVSEWMQLELHPQWLPVSFELGDLGLSFQKIKIEGQYLEEHNLVELLHFLRNFHQLHKFLLVLATKGDRGEENFSYLFSQLASSLQDIAPLPKTEQNISRLLDAEGCIKDSASRELADIRRKKKQTEREISIALERSLRRARQEGWVEMEAHPTFREGRLVLPVLAMHKRSIPGIVHDESATGKTLFIEPSEVVEVNNRLRELELEERRELVRILKHVTQQLRPNYTHLDAAYRVMVYCDLVQAKARLAKSYQGSCPEVEDKPGGEWYSARNPLLERSLNKQGRKVVPLNISWSEEKQRILVISGPNAGGKSVCLKTVGLLQYMLQLGLAVPLADNSRMGVFSKIFTDIGDQQSMEDDLSTYSSHLRNMKMILRECDDRSLVLIDEFGSGTEPTIGGALATAILHQFNRRRVFGVITTHYQALKEFSEQEEGIVNAAMVYDRHKLCPLFQLSIGRPGSSFAVEIARQIGLPQSVIQEAIDLVGVDYIHQDKFLQDITRDKRYWESKRTEIRQKEKRIEEELSSYELKLKDIKVQRQQILAEARAEAERLIKDANKRIEQTIREIREAEAERSKTKELRNQLEIFAEELQAGDKDKAEKLERELQAVLRRKKRQKERKAEARGQSGVIAPVEKGSTPSARNEVEQFTFKPGDVVTVEGQKAEATIISLGEDTAEVALGNLKLRVSIDKLKPTKAKKQKISQGEPVKNTTQWLDELHQKRLHFTHQLDVRGFRLAEALDAVAYFIDEAVQLSIDKVSILHGTGSGALRQAIRDYLGSQKMLVRRYYDEDIRFGGAGITIIELK